MEHPMLEEWWDSTFTTFGGYWISNYHPAAIFKLEYENVIILNAILNLYHGNYNIFILFNKFDYQNDELIIELRKYIKSDMPLPEYIDINVNGNSKRLPISYTEDMETNNNIKNLMYNSYEMQLERN